MPRTKKNVNKPSVYGSPYRPRGSNDASFSDSIQDLNTAFWQYRTLLEGYVINRVKWNGLPETVSERYLERTLMIEGQAVLFKSATGIPMGLKVVSQGVPTPYGDASSMRAFGDNGWEEEVPLDRGVWVWDQQTRYSSYPVLVRYARKLANLDMLQEANRDQQRQVVVFAGTQDNQQDLAHLVRAMRMNEHSLVVDNKLIDGNPVQVIQTGVEYKQADFNADKKSLFNDFFDHFGIDHASFEKSAHVLESEISVNNDAIGKIRENFILPRRLAAKRASEIFGTEVTVEWRKDEFDILNNNVTSNSSPAKEENS